METGETFTMSHKEVPRAGLLKAALAGKTSNSQGTNPSRRTPPRGPAWRSPHVISAGRARRAVLPDPGINLQSIFGPRARVPTECLPLDQPHHGIPQLLGRHGSFHGDHHG